MKEINFAQIRFSALSQNESFARATVAGFCLELNPTIDELTDIKTAVSEAVTNSIVHAYADKQGEIEVKVWLFDNSQVKIEIRDFGSGIENIEEAKKPFFTTKPLEERSGMGFTVMESFMDTMKVENASDGAGLVVTLTKKIKDEASNLKLG